MGRAQLCLNDVYIILIVTCIDNHLGGGGGERELLALLCLSSWCLVIAVWLPLAVPRVYLEFVIVFFLIILTYYVV